MDLTIDLSTVVQAALTASILWHVKSIRELVTIAKLHDWRLKELESKGKCKV